jgi:putative peptidoglycan lipid II flippase
VARHSTARAGAVIALGTALGKITGVARVGAIAYALGISGSRLADTYHLANSLPNIVYDLAAGAILSTVLIPVFAEWVQHRGKLAAWHNASAVSNVALLFLCGVTTAVVLLAPLIASAYASGLPEAEADLQRHQLTFLIQLFAPQILFYGIATLSTGLLHAHRRFVAAAFSPVAANLVTIATLVAFRSIFGEESAESVQRSALFLLGLGTTLGVATMASIQVWYLRRLAEYSFTWDVRSAGVGKLSRLSLLAVANVSITLVGFIAVQWLANRDPGAFATYQAATIFLLLPFGLFAASILNALQPGMSEAALGRDTTALQAKVEAGVKATYFLILPSVIFLLAMGQTVVRLVIEHGMASRASTAGVNDVLAILLLGLLQFALFQAYMRAFYAKQDGIPPLLINLLATGSNILAAILLFPEFGVRGLAIGWVVGSSTGAIAGAKIYRSRVARQVTIDLTSRARIALAALGMAALLVPLEHLLEPWLHGGIGFQLLALCIAVLLSSSCYLGVCHLLDVQEARSIVAIFKRRSRLGSR